MSPEPLAEQPKRSLLASPGIFTLGLLALIFGLMGTMVGGMLLSLCLFGGGILCSGTMIGEMGGGALKLGLPLLILGFAIWIPSRKAMKAQQRERLEQLRLARASTPSRSFAEVFPGLDAAPGPVASKCPECGAPVERGAKECEYCGQPFV